MEKKITVLGLGNLIYGDEGFGIHAMRSLQAELGSPESIDWIDGGVLGLHLLPLVEESSHLLVLDAVDSGQLPGAVIELTESVIPRYSGIKMSEHQVQFQEVLAIASMRGRLPKFLKIIGAQPADFSTSVQLSQTLITALPQVVEMAIKVLAGWNVLEGRQVLYNGNSPTRKDPQ